MTAPDGAATVELLAELIRNACVNDGTADSGHEHRSVATLAGFLGEAGTVFEPHPGRQSALYRVPGTVPGAPRLMLMGHTDVVPASDAGWEHPPFGGVWSDGFVWGRGAVDMLNQTATMAAVFRPYLAGELEPLPGDLLYLAVADEEAAGAYGAGWITENHWDQVACEYLITEIGAPFLAGADGRRGLPVTVAEKGVQWKRLRSAGIPGHGSQPYGTRNALAPLAAAVSRLAEVPSPVVITDEWRAFVEAWGPEPGLAADLLDPDHLDAAIDLIAIEDLGLARWIHACTHMTVSPNTLRAGVKVNVVPDGAEGEVDVRVVPGQDETSVLDHFRKAIGPDLEEQVTVESIEADVAGGSPAAGSLWEAMSAALEEITGSGRLIPALIPVGTDARFFRRRGTRAYGISVYDDRVTFGEFLAMFHGRNERVSDESLALTTRHLAATVRRFGELTAGEPDA
jgi:acetylornithine deacetylase/succinyl-diaminopimelate desuccinylase-like protein